MKGFTFTEANTPASTYGSLLTQASALASGSLFEPAHFALATYYAQTGDVDRARHYLREVLLHTNSPQSLQRAQTMLTALE